MELSGPTVVTPTLELPAAHTGKTGGAVDPFFTNVRSELSDKGFLVAAADNLISWARRLAHVDAVWTCLLRDRDDAVCDAAL
jgi:hypothetical protein